MTRLGFYIAASWTILCTYSVAMPDIHHQMTPVQLQEVFHVDHADAVPHYEVVQLIHHTNVPALHHRHKRSIEAGSAKASAGNLLQQGGAGNHHVKKDLSKVKFRDRKSVV